jgi:hypothetical protein
LCTHWHSLPGIENAFDKLVFYQLIASFDCSAKRYICSYLSPLWLAFLMSNDFSIYLYGYRTTQKTKKKICWMLQKDFFSISFPQSITEILRNVYLRVQSNEIFRHNLTHEPFLFITQNHIEYQQVVINRNGENVR